MPKILQIACSLVFVALTHISEGGGVMLMARRNIMSTSNHFWTLNTQFDKDGNELEYIGRAVSGFIEIPDRHTITWKFGRADLDYYDNLGQHRACLIEYDYNKQYQSYWGSFSSNTGVRTLNGWDFPKSIGWIRFTADMNYLDDCYVKDNVTGLYLWKGKNVNV